MKHVLTLIVALLAPFAVMAQSVPTQIEGSTTNVFTEANEIGRGYEITGFVAAVRNDTTTTNTATIAIVNSQDVDLTGTNATVAEVTYDLKASGNYTGSYSWFPTTEKYLVPAGSTLKVTFTGGTTNDFVVFRQEQE